MSVSNVRTLLLNLAIKEKEDNKIAKILTFYLPNIAFSDKKSLFESLLYYYQISENTVINLDKIIGEIENDNEIESLYGKDFRIKSLQVSDLRGIPEKDKSGTPFGINFFEKGSINNAVILANNGTGKSSIFAGLEMLFAQEIGEKQLRTLYPEALTKHDYDNYLKRFPTYLKPSFQVETNEGSFDLEKIIFPNERTRKLLNPSNHFISDFDIYNYGQKEYDGNSDNENSFHSLIAKSLGLGEFINLQTRLQEVSNYRRITESGNLGKLNTKKNDLTINIKNFEAEIQSKNILLKEFTDTNTNNTPDINKTQGDRIRRLNELLEKPIQFQIGISEYLDTLEKFNITYKESLSLIIDEKKTVEKDFLDAGLGLIHDFHNCPFCQSSSKPVDEIQKGVESRLKILKESQKIEEGLREQYLLLIDSLLTFFERASNIYKLIQNEKSEIVGLKELTKLTENEEQLVSSFSSELSDEVLIEYYRLLSKKSYPNQSDYKTLFDFSNKPSIKKNEDIIQKFNDFLELRNTILKKSIEDLSKDSSALTIEKQVAVLEEDIKRLKQSIETSQKEIDSLLPKILIAEKDVLLVAKIRKEVSDFVDPLDKKINELVNEAFLPIQDIVETIINDYLIKDSLKFRIDRKEIKKIVDGEEIINNTIRANIEFVDTKTGEIKTITPDLYFNTFRYKLFCLMVSLSLALATRKKYNVNLPLVMDDLFFASDYISKNSFAEFLQKIVKLFYKHTPNLPLQFILFTHDDLIFRCAVDAIESFSINLESTFCEENKRQLIEKTTIGRFFDPEDKDDFLSKFEDEKNYWNLLYKIPKTITQLTKN